MGFSLEDFKSHLNEINLKTDYIKAITPLSIHINDALY